MIQLSASDGRRIQELIEERLFNSRRMTDFHRRRWRALYRRIGLELEEDAKERAYHADLKRQERARRAEAEDHVDVGNPEWTP
jgi:hypothetical protein